MAESLCRRGLREAPHDVNLLQLAGVACYLGGKVDDAMKFLRRAAMLEPRSAAIQSNLGLVTRGHGDLERAIQHYRKAVELDPQCGDYLSNLGDALRASGKLEEAAGFCERAVKVNPSGAGLNNLGTVLQEQGRLQEAISTFRRAVALEPTLATAWSNFAGALEAAGRIDEASEAHRQAIHHNPKETAINDALIYSASATPEEIFAEHQRWARQYAKPLAHLIPRHENAPTPDRRLRIGYISPDFSEHAIMYYLEPILEHRDREGFEVFLYSSRDRADDVTRRYQSLCDQWREIAKFSDEEIAAQIVADRIDILVDLATHTAGNRLLVFARKPAPVQVTYLGYAGTTGLETMDWRITDRFVDPPGVTEALHTEKLFRLPSTQWCYRPPPQAPAITPLPASATGRITFGSANKLSKMTPFVMRLWAEVLKRLPESRLFMRADAFRDAATRKELERFFGEEGIDASRLAFYPWGSMQEYLEFFNQVDIVLDTFPFNGGTTTCHSLWMGVPVVSLAGRTSVSRVGSSVLRNVGLGELAAETSDEFVEAAVKLAGDKARLETLRSSLRARIEKSPLRDERAFVQQLEDGYRQMWRNWCDQTEGEGRSN